MSDRYFLKTTALVCLSCMIAVPSFANGLLESRPWQFQTSADRANKAVVLDLIERKKGGFYDGFSTNIFNETNIGSQINCNNNANATANIADNGQAGPNTEANGTPSITADSTGNSDTTSAQSNGPGNGGAVGGGDTNQASSQDNSGSIDSSVDNSNIDNSFGDVANGDTNQALNNDQNNSGNQTAGVDGSTACNFDGSKITGNSAVPSNAPLN